MKIVFVSNYFNHHQKPFCEAIYAKISDDFTFVSTREIREDRRKLGYELESYPSYIAYAYTGEEDKRKCLDLIDAADVVIIGSAPEEYIENRKKQGKLIFRYSERLYRKGYQLYKWPVRALKFRQRYSLKKNQYLLCAGAYTSADFAITRTFINRAYKWGYFPETKKYDANALMRSKDNRKILWCARFIDCKHPEHMVALAERLKKENYRFDLDCIGIGPLKDQTEEMIRQKGLEDCVHLLGAMKPEQVREHMERAGIFLFTSDFEEGWGAVLNESMNSGCAVVASHAIGAAPFLIQNKENGLIYRYGNFEDMYGKVTFLLNTPEEQLRMGRAAYETIATKWNAEVAAERFLRLAEEISEGRVCTLYEDGPCSKAEILKNNWFKG